MKYIFLISCLLISFFGFNQSLNFRFDGTVSNVDSGKKEGGVTVSIVQNGSTVFSTTSSSNGKYVLTGPINYGSPFDVVFNKAGLVSKRINFNFTGLNEEDTPAGADFKPVQDLSIDVFGDRPNVDFSFLETQPVAKFDWDPKKGGANLNSSVVAQMRTKIDKLLIDSEKNAAQAEANYNAAIAEADKQYAAKSYPAALKKYEEAYTIKPKEKYPSDRIVELDALIQKNNEAALVDKQENQEYYNLIQAADNFRNAKDYVKAKAKYSEAITKKDEQYPKDEIKKLDALIKEKEAQADYDAAVVMGDMMLKQKSFKAARDKYTEASKLKPSEQYPKTKLAELDAMIKSQEDVVNLKKKYDALVAEGDNLFTSEKLEESKLKYKEALAIESASTYVSGRIKLIDETLAKQKAEKEKADKIAKLLSEGETAMIERRYDASLLKFKEVIALDAINQTAISKISEIEGLIAEQEKNAALTKQFNDLVKKGDDAVVIKKLEIAVTNYEQALALKADAGLQVKLSDIKKQIEDLKNAGQINADYAKLIAEGKSAFDMKDYATALGKYEGAKALKPNEILPKTKIEEINNLLKKQQDEASKNAKITALLNEGEGLIQSQTWEGAKLKFTEVLAIAPTNETAKAKIKEIDAKIFEQKANADKDAKFTEFVSKGDIDAGADKLASAITNYKEALKIKQDNSVQQKIDAAQAKLNDQAALAGNKAKYQAAILEADKLKTEKKLELAKDKYTLAKSLDGSENYPSEQIAIIDKLLSDQLAAKDKEAQIQKLMTEGNTLFASKDFSTSKTKYEQILIIDNANAPAIKKLAEVNDALSKMMDQAAKDKEFEALKKEGMDLFAKNELNPAKTKLNSALQLKDDADIKKKILEIDAQLKLQADRIAKIGSLLLEGQKQFDAKSFIASKTAYDGVLALDSENAEAKSKLSQIAAELLKQQGAEQQKAAFEKLKKEGFDLAKTKDYANAKSKLNEALAIQEDPSIRQKISEIDGLIAQESKADKLEEQYADLLSKGEALATSEKYSDAIAKFTEASALKPNEAFPKKRVTELNALIKAKSQDTELDKKYNAALEKGDKLVSSKDYVGAIAAYNEALAMKPTEKLPVDKAKIAQGLADVKGQSEFDGQYEKILSAIEAKIESNEFPRAKELVARALTIKPDDNRPNALLDRINQIEKRNADFKALMLAGDKQTTAKEYQKAINTFEQAKALNPSNPEPDAKIATIRQLMDAANKSNDQDVLFKDYVAKGDAFAVTTDLQNALLNYKGALAIKPSDASVKAKIVDIEKRMSDLADEKARNAANQAKFNALIVDADKFFGSEEFKNAVDKYSAALELIPSNEYAKSRLEASRNQLSKKSKDEVEREYEKIITAADKYFNLADYSKAIDYYKRALSFRANDAYPKKKLAEIDAILNPVVTNSALLLPLGEIYDNSVMDGSTALAQAEQQRKNLKTTTMKTKLDEIADVNAEISLNKTKENLKSANEIYSIYRNISESNVDRDIGRQEMVEAIKKSENQRSSSEAELGSYEHSSVINLQGQINEINKMNLISYGESESLYMDNSQELARIKVETSDVYSDKSINYYAENLASAGSIDNVNENYSTEFLESRNERIAEGQKLEGLRISTEEISKDISYANYDKNLATSGSLAAVNDYASSIATQNALLPGENNLLITDVKLEAAKLDGGIQEVQRNRVLAVDQQLINVRTENAIQDASRGDKQKENILYVNQLDKKATIVSGAINLSDEEQRLQSQKGIDNSKIAIAQKNIEDQDQVKLLSVKMDDLTKSISANEAVAGNEQKESLLAAQDKLDNTSGARKEKVVIANSLGNEYPEGVSQEVFQSKDMNGILEAIITRRIVVIQGKGDVYVKTQRLDSITYSKNGSSTTEFIWQKETQPAGLERHY